MHAMEPMQAPGSACDSPKGFQTPLCNSRGNSAMMVHPLFSAPSVCELCMARHVRCTNCGRPWDYG